MLGTWLWDCLYLEGVPDLELWEVIPALLLKPNWAHGGFKKLRKVTRILDLPHPIHPHLKGAQAKMFFFQNKQIYHFSNKHLIWTVTTYSQLKISNFFVSESSALVCFRTLTRNDRWLMLCLIQTRTNPSPASESL
jgi:hypothetical protein